MRPRHVITWPRDRAAQWKRLFAVGAGLGENFPGRSRHKTLSPELDALAAHALEDFVAHTIGHAHITTIRDGMAPLDRFPRIMLERAVFLLLARMPANGRGVKTESPRPAKP